MRPSLAKYILLPIVIVLASCINDEDYSIGIISSGDKLPQFEAKLNDGSVFEPSKAAERPIVLIFFNTSCEDCRAELPIVQQVYEELNESATFIAIAREENAQSIEEYWKANGLTLPYSAQNDRYIYNMFAKSGIPRIYIANSSLTVCSAFGPENAPSSEILRSAIEKSMN